VVLRGVHIKRVNLPLFFTLTNYLLHNKKHRVVVARTWEACHPQGWIR